MCLHLHGNFISRKHLVASNSIWSSLYTLPQYTMACFQCQKSHTATKLMRSVAKLMRSVAKLMRSVANLWARLYKKIMGLVFKKHEVGCRAEEVGCRAEEVGYRTEEVGCRTEEVGINYVQWDRLCQKFYGVGSKQTGTVGHVAPAPPFKWAWFVMFDHYSWLASLG